MNSPSDYYSTPGPHETTVLVMGTVRNPVYAAECSCGWESYNYCTHRRQASDDARAHRKAEAEGQS